MKKKLMREKPYLRLSQENKHLSKLARLACVQTALLLKRDTQRNADLIAILKIINDINSH